MSEMEPEVTTPVRQAVLRSLAEAATCFDSRASSALERGMAALSAAVAIDGLPPALKATLVRGLGSFQRALELEGQGLWDDAERAAKKTIGERAFLEIAGSTGTVGRSEGGLELWRKIVNEFLNLQRSRRLKAERKE